MIEQYCVSVVRDEDLCVSFIKACKSVDGLGDVIRLVVCIAISFFNSIPLVDVVTRECIKAFYPHTTNKIFIPSIDILEAIKSHDVNIVETKDRGAGLTNSCMLCSMNNSSLTRVQAMQLRKGIGQKILEAVNKLGADGLQGGDSVSSEDRLIQASWMRLAIDLKVSYINYKESEENKENPDFEKQDYHDTPYEYKSIIKNTNFSVPYEKIEEGCDGQVEAIKATISEEISNAYDNLELNLPEPCKEKFMQMACDGVFSGEASAAFDNNMCSVFLNESADLDRIINLRDLYTRQLEQHTENYNMRQLGVEQERANQIYRLFTFEKIKFGGEEKTILEHVCADVLVSTCFLPTELLTAVAIANNQVLFGAKEGDPLFDVRQNQPWIVAMGNEFDVAKLPVYTTCEDAKMQEDILVQNRGTVSFGLEPRDRMLKLSDGRWGDVDPATITPYDEKDIIPSLYTGFCSQDLIRKFVQAKETCYQRREDLLQKDVNFRVGLVEIVNYGGNKGKHWTHGLPPHDEVSDFLTARVHDPESTNACPEYYYRSPHARQQLLKSLEKVKNRSQALVSAIKA